VKAEQDFSIYNPDGHFVQHSKSCQRYAQLGMEVTIPVKFG
jgi:hypothetical protein